MSAEQAARASDATVVHISERLRGRGVEPAARDAVQTTPAGVADVSAGSIRLGREGGADLRKVRDAAVRAPLWRRTAGTVRSGAYLTGLGVATTLSTAYHYQQGGEYVERIRAARRQLDRTIDDAERAELCQRVAHLRAERKKVVRARHRERATIAGAAAAGSAVVALTLAATLWSAALTAPALLPVVAVMYVVGRKEHGARQALPAVQAEAVAGQVALSDGPTAASAWGVAGVYSPEQLPEGRPFPIAHATTETEAAECILRALLKEDVPVGDVSEVQRTAWGWQAVVRVTEGTPAAIIQKADDLETLFDTGHGSVRVQPMIERRARAKFRIVQSDPFASAPAPEYRAPRSLSITDRARIGSSIDGDPLLATLAGVMGEVIAASGGGKTGILQALAEVTTACEDAITIDLDPAGDGLEDLGPAARLQGRTHEQIEHVLLWLLMLAKARARLRAKLGMGRKWVASPEHPSIVTFIDEYPKLSKLGKKLAFELLLVGRKEAIPVIIASQGGTVTYLGENIAQMLALKIVGPCKKVDTDAVFGPGAVGEGWLPHRLSPATDTDPRDAGHVYAQGIPGTQDAPVEYKIHEHPKGVLARLAEERREAGLLDPDTDSLAAMEQVDLPDYVEPTYDSEGNLKKEAPVELLTWEQLLRLCDADPPAAGVTPDTPAQETVRKAIAAMEERAVDRMRTERLADVLGVTPDRLRELLREAGVERCQLGALDGLANPGGYKLAHLKAAL